MSMRPGLRDRIWLFVVLLILALGLGAQAGLGRLDAMWYDFMLTRFAPAGAGDTVVVGIDEASLAEHGRWPWDRRLHADLIERIAADEPRAIVLDLLLSEPASEAEDAALAGALRRSGRVVLPVFTAPQPQGGVRAMPPVPVLAQAAAGLGHVSLQTDADGVARSIFLREGNDAQGWWNHVALELLRVAGSPPETLPGVRAPQSPQAALSWRRDHWMLLTFARTLPPTVSAGDVLAGEVPPGAFTDRIVMIGVLAGGLGDLYPTPISHTAYTPGVYLLATALANLVDDDAGVAAGPLANTVFTLLVLCLLVPVYRRASPSHALFWTCAVGVAALAASALLWVGWRLWCAPMAAVCVCLAAYPFWSWRRLETASAYLDEELARLRRERALLPAGLHASSATYGDTVDRRIGAMRAATANLRALTDFVSAAIEHLPDATLVTDAHGTVRLANRAATRYFAAENGTSLVGMNAARLLAGLRTREALEPVAPPPVACTVECSDARGGDFLYKSARLEGPAAPGVCIATLVDIARVRQAEQRRDEALRFLSHDLRSPLTAIMALIDGRAADELAAGERDARIGRLAGQALHLAESFVQLARAESAPLRDELLDLADVVMDAEDACWALTREAEVELESAPELPAPAEVQGDRAWLTRALVNLLGNAIKFSPAGGVVRIELARGQDAWRLSVSDQGPGLPPEALDRLGTSFVRLDPTMPGVGLGLAYVRTVAARHGGRLLMENRAEGGARVSLLLPVAQRAQAPRALPPDGG